jgi:hypothetical protein
MGEWKYEKFSKDTINVTKHDTFPRTVLSLKSVNNINPGNTFCQAMAGTGKTYKIVNEITKPYDKSEVLIVTPTNATRNDYLACGFDCEVVQGYTFAGKVPSDKYKIKIFDEVGMYAPSDWNIIVSTIMRGDLVYAFGDFGQLKPAGCLHSCDSKFFHQLYFPIHDIMTENMRNDFTAEYYESLKKIYDPKLGYLEVQKHQVPWEVADVVICHNNATVDMYNEMVMNLKGIKFGDVGCRVICKSSTMKKYNMVNNLELIVKDYDDKFVYFENGTQVPLKLFKWDKTHFAPSYACTIHRLQGKSLNSFHFAQEDADRLIGNELYTVISRLKTKY